MDWTDATKILVCTEYLTVERNGISPLFYSVQTWHNRIFGSSITNGEGSWTIVNLVVQPLLQFFQQLVLQREIKILIR